MRLFEVEDRLVNDLIPILRNLVGRSDSPGNGQQSSPQPFSYAQLNGILKNLGYGPIDAGALKSLYDSSDALQHVIKDPAETGEEVVLKTEDERQKQQLTRSPGQSVDTMAHQGAQDYQSDISK
jgi:hypothetical protein